MNDTDVTSAFDALTSGQAVMHSSRHRLTAYVTRRMYASTNDQWACRAGPLVSLSKTKPCQFSSVTSLCTRLVVKCVVDRVRRCRCSTTIRFKFEFISWPLIWPMSAPAWMKLRRCVMNTRNSPLNCRSASTYISGTARDGWCGATTPQARREGEGGNFSPFENPAVAEKYNVAYTVIRHFYKQFKNPKKNFLPVDTTPLRAPRECFLGPRCGSRLPWPLPPTSL